MQIDETKSPKEAAAVRDSKKLERRAAMARFKLLHALDPVQAREAARLWFEQNAGPATAGVAETSAFHLRKLSETDPERVRKAAQALLKSEADAEKAQKVARETVKDWRKRNPNKVKKLNKLYRERQKSMKGHK